MATPGNGVLQRTAHALHVCALGVWTGAIAMTAGAAAVIFPTVKQLTPHVPRYAAVPDEGHWLLLAGNVASRVFAVSDKVQLGCAAVTLVTAVVLARARGFHGALAGKARAAALICALLLVTYYLAVLVPRMTAHLHEHWRLSEAGEVEQARVHENAFKNDHPTSSRVLAATAACTLVALLLGAGSPVCCCRRDAE
ncbi:MAG: hypothetical protein U0637_09915 [Phycisphaerales bacterium]